MFKRSSILRATGSIQSSFVADTYRVGVVVTAVCPDLFERTATVDLSVACNVEMIADVAESPVEDVVHTGMQMRQTPSTISHQAVRWQEYL